MTSRPEDEASGSGRGAGRTLTLLALCELLGMSVWFTAAAVAPELDALWDLGPGRAGSLTTAVQYGFVAGTAAAALLTLADLWPARFLFGFSAWAAAAANLLLLISPGYGVALATRFATGFFLAGVYPPAMKMAATWFRSGRGFAIGTLVGALTVGKALPYLMKALPGITLHSVVLGGTVAAFLGGTGILLFYRDGPHRFDRAPFRWDRVWTVASHRETRLAIFGYLGHMWELYAVWAAFAVFLTDLWGSGGVGALGLGAASGVAFLAIAAGGPGSVLAGVWADRMGRERVAAGAMAVSGLCALTVGWIASSIPSALLVGLLLLWGAAVVADSAQFSALVTEVAPSDAVGTALTLQTSAGFLLTGISIPLTLSLGSGVGWGPAFALLALGPLFGIVAMARLARIRQGTVAG